MERQPYTLYPFSAGERAHGTVHDFTFEVCSSVSSNKGMSRNCTNTEHDLCESMRWNITNSLCAAGTHFIYRTKGHLPCVPVKEQICTYLRQSSVRFDLFTRYDFVIFAVVSY